MDIDTKRVVTEEDLEEKLEEFRERALRFIPLQRYERKAPGARDAVATATSLKMLDLAIGSFLERTQPDPSFQMDNTGADSMTAQISVHRVITKNLLPLQEEIGQFMQGLVILEDEEV